MAEKIKVYGTLWCGDTQRARRFLESEGVEYEWVDISTDIEAARYVEQVNDGQRSVPTIVFPDGEILVEPSLQALRRKLDASAAK